MRWVAETVVPRTLKCIIRREIFTDMRDKPAGSAYCLEVYESGEKGGAWDYLQDTLEQTKEFAFEEFQVPLDAWVAVA